MSASAARQNWSADVAAGIGAGLAYAPLIPVVGFLAFGALGPQVASSMTAVVFAANLLAGCVVLLLARSPLVVGITSGTCAIAMAGLFVPLAGHGAEPDVPQVMAMTLCTVAVAGIVQLALVWLGAAALGPLTPYPVIAGLVNGTAALAFLSQWPALSRNPAETLVAVVTGAVVLWFPPRWKVPPVLPAIAAGIGVYAVLHHYGVPAGPALSAMPSPIAYPSMALAAAAALTWHAAALPWPGILATGVTAAVLGVLETLTTVTALADAGISVEGRRDLRAVAVANLAVSAMAGGPPIAAPVATAFGLLKLGGSGRLASIFRLVTVGSGGLLLGRYLPLVPHGVLVGLVLAIGVRLFDAEPLRLLWRAARQKTPHQLEIAFNALISLAVVVVAVLAGLAVAVAVGAVACLLVFTAAMTGNAVRRVFDGAAMLSRVRRSAEETAILLRDRRSVAVLELVGPLFFGNVSPLARALEQAREFGARHVVIDLTRIMRVDLSGARRLILIVRQHRRQGLAVVLAPIRPGHPVADYLVALNLDPGDCARDITAALAAAEAMVLAEAGLATPSYATAEQALQALGVPAEHLGVLAKRAEIRELAAGEVLCRGGDPADAVFVLMRGGADVLLPQPHGAGRVLLAHLSPGAVLGERALFEAGTRSADVVCPVQSRVLILSRPMLAALQREASPATLALVLAITRSTSLSLEHANAAIERLEL
jgi:SulP family sulfate permease